MSSFPTGKSRDESAAAQDRRMETGSRVGSGGSGGASQPDDGVVRQQGAREVPALPSERGPTNASASGLAPFYATERVSLYVADARDVLPEFTTESFDLVVTDPPYGQDFRSNQRVERFDRIALDGADDRDAVRGILEECVRLQ